MLKWLCNTCDPRLPESASSVSIRYGQTLSEAIQEQRDFLKDKLIGEPQATESYSAAELKAMGLVGVYKVVDNTPEEN